MSRKGIARRDSSRNEDVGKSTDTKRAAALEEERVLRALHNDLAVVQQRQQAAKAREVEGQMRIAQAAGGGGDGDSAGGQQQGRRSRHAEFVGQKVVEKAQDEQQEASVAVARLQFEVSSKEKVCF